MLDAVLLSDLHLGAETCQVRALQQCIDNLPTTARLILNGDVLENTEYRLTKQHWRVLSRLRKLSDQLELVWVRGNHDYDAESVAHLIGANFVSEYAFESGGRRIVCVHGDIYDKFLTDHPWLIVFADWFYLRMQGMSRRLAINAKRSSKTFIRCVERVRTRAIEYARSQGAAVVVCGHTHHAEIPAEPAYGMPSYFNTGCWTDLHCHFITVKDGDVDMHEVDVENLQVAAPTSLPTPQAEHEASPQSIETPISAS